MQLSQSKTLASHLPHKKWENEGKLNDSSSVDPLLFYFEMPKITGKTLTLRCRSHKERPPKTIWR